jgi:thiamine pyrophosphate-dependent acetolactate synthase large subunit-like protein
VVQLALAHGIEACTVETAAELAGALGQPGPWVVRVRTDRADNVRVHAELNAAVAAALDR